MAPSRRLHPVGSTFLIFSDYMRPSCASRRCRGSARSGFTRTTRSRSGEDGPTHRRSSTTWHYEQSRIFSSWPGRCQRGLRTRGAWRSRNRHRRRYWRLTRARNVPTFDRKPVLVRRRALPRALRDESEVDEPDVSAAGDRLRGSRRRRRGRTLAEKESGRAWFPCPGELFEELAARTTRGCGIPERSRAACPWSQGSRSGWQKWVRRPRTFDRHRTASELSAPGAGPHEGVRLHRGSRRRRALAMM
jgi:hypothetical protein